MITDELYRKKLHCNIGLNTHKIYLGLIWYRKKDVCKSIHTLTWMDIRFKNEKLRTVRYLKILTRFEMRNKDVHPS